MPKSHYIPVTFKVDGCADRNEAALRVLAAIAQDETLSATLTSIAQEGISPERLARAQAAAVALILKSQDLPKMVAAGKASTLNPDPVAAVEAAALDAMSECQICGKPGDHYAEAHDGTKWWLCDGCHSQD